jgi:hypothetical protein
MQGHTEEVFGEEYGVMATSLEGLTESGELHE